MYKFKFVVAVLFFILLTKISYSQPFQLVNAFPNVSFSSPLFVTHANDGSNRVFIAEKNALIKVLPNDSNTTNSKIYLNITNKIITGSERGLLGLAFHPNYASNGYFYVNYTRAGDGATIVSRFTKSSTDPDKADSLSEQILLNIAQPYSNHNGGIIFFGLDGYLYIGMGDGGSANDPGNRAQNANVLLGKVLRIDVNNTSGGNNYAIPPTNPFASGGGSPEIYTLGMRNPWRMSQDPVTGIIYCGDVGQDAWEEVDIIELGKNYGWKCYEGNHPTSSVGLCTLPMSDYTFPVKEYANAGSDCSITGGYVYRGLRRPELTGRYIYADYCSAKMWKFKYEGGVVSEDELLMNAPSSVYSFGTDQNNELYVCCANNIVYRFNKSDLVGINNNISEIPSGFKLEQNYPNPFNPETNISYYIPQMSNVKLTIFDALGKEINTLVNTNQMAGSYSINWNGRDVYGNTASTGVYFYKLETSGFTETKRMVLMK